MPDPQLSVPVNNLNENVGENSASGPRPSIESHTVTHNVETGVSDQNVFSNKVNPPSDNTQTQIPIPKARSSGISSSQPTQASYSIYNQIKRALSLSPQNTPGHYSTPKSARLTGNVDLV